MISFETKSTKKSTLFISFIWAIISGILVLSLENINTLISHNILVLFILVSYLLCFITWRRAGGAITSVYNFFIAYALLSNLGASLIYSTLSWTNSAEFLKVYEFCTWNSVVDMLRFQLLCVSFMNLGTALCVSKYPIYSPPEIDSSYSEPYSIVDTFWWICSLFQLFLGIRYLFMRSTMTYMELDKEMVSEDWGLFGVLSTYGFLFLSMLLLLKGRKIKLVYIFLVILSFLFMVAGKRYVAIRYVGALAVFMPLTHSKCFQRKYAGFWALGVFAFLAFINILRMTRGDTLSAISVDDKGFFDLILGTFAEMGQSEWPAIIIMDHLEGTGERVYTLFSAFARTFGLDVLLGFHTSQSLGVYVTRLMDAHYGLGGSYIAESFANFGWYGCIYTLFYGWMIAFLEGYAYQNLNSSQKRLLSIAILALLLRQVFYARAQLDLCAFDLRMLFLIWLVTIVFNKNRNASY